MSGATVWAWLSLGLAVPAAAVLAGRAVGRKSPALLLLYATVACAGLLILPVQAEAALQLWGPLDRIGLAGPALVSGLVLLWWWVTRRARAPAADAPAWERGRLGLRIPEGLRAPAVLLVLLYGFFALERILGYPISWDGVSYHLPVAAAWLREGSLAIAPDAHFYEAVPWAGDVPNLLALATGWFPLAELWNLLSAAMLLSAAYLLARRIGVGRGGAATVVLMVASVPVVLYETFSAYVDLLVAAGLAGSLALLVVLFTSGSGRDRRPAVLLLGAGLACGLAVGTKPTAWPMALMLAVAVLAWTAWKGEGVVGRGVLLAAFFGAAAAPGVFWFVRNAAATGNPAYPMEVAFLGHQLFAGTPVGDVSFDPTQLDLLGQLGHWLTVPWRDGAGSGYPYSTGDGFGPLFAGLVVPGLLYLAWSFRRWRRIPGARRRPWRLRAGLVVLLGLLCLSWWYVLTPVWRYGLINVVLACVLAGPFAARFRDSFPGLFRAVLLTAVIVLAAVAVTPRAQDLAHRVLHGEWTWAEYYHLPAVYGEVPEDATVINYDAGPEGWNNFALMGPDLQRRVVPDWKIETALPQGRAPLICGAWVVDREPLQFPPPEIEERRADLRLVADTTAAHGDVRWRIWRVKPDCGDP